MSVLLRCGGIAIDPKNSSNLYAGSGGGDGDCGGLFRSVDAGMNWANIGFVDCISALVGDPQNPGTVYYDVFWRPGQDQGPGWGKLD